MSAELVLAAGLAVCLVIYVLGAGADFGAGVWDMLARGSEKDAQRRLIENAMGPVWEANHVWLIFATVLLFAGFPRAFATVATGLHVPLTFFLFGVVLRGSMFTFRHYDAARRAPAYAAVFAAASLWAPFWLGASAAMLSAPWVAESVPPPWMSAFGVTVGVLVIALFALLACVYLAWEASNAPAIARLFQTRAYVTLFVVLVLLAAATAQAVTAAPAMVQHLAERPLSLAAIALATVSALALVLSLRARRFHVARLAVAGFVAMLVVGWASQRLPWLVEPVWTIHDAAAHRVTLHVLIATSLVGACMLVPSLWFLFRVFKGKPTEDPASELAAHADEPGQ